MRRAVLRPLVVVVAVVTMAVGLVAVPAAAHTGDAPATGPGQEHPWDDDGCTIVPDVIPGLFQFTHACQHHDGCYGAGDVPRFACDVRFLFDMRASCRTVWTSPDNREECLRLARVYFLGVRLFGGLYRDDVL